MQSRPSRSPNLSGAKQAAKTTIKTIAPFVITGLAAIAEHHFLKHDNKRDDASNDDGRPPASEQERDDDSSVRRLKQDVRDLKRSLKRNTKKVVEVALEPSLSNAESSLEAVIGSERAERRRDRRRDVREACRRPDREISGGLEQRNIPEIRIFPPPPPRVPSPPFGIPSYIPIYEPPVYEPPPMQDRPREHNYTSHRHTRNQHRDTSLSPWLPKDEDCFHATTVATVAGIMEGLYVADSKGDWLGTKGIRVGTAMAAAAGTSYVRERKRDDGWLGDMAVDAGAGLLATRLLYGSKRRRRENESGKERKGQRN